MWLNNIHINKGEPTTQEICEMGNVGSSNGVELKRMPMSLGTNDWLGQPQYAATASNVQDVLTKKLCSNKAHKCTRFTITQSDNPTFNMTIYCGNDPVTESEYVGGGSSPLSMLN